MEKVLQLIKCQTIKNKETPHVQLQNITVKPKQPNEQKKGQN